jgi:hypothetical protein
LNGKETYEKQDGKVDKNIDNTVEIHCDKTCKTVKPKICLHVDKPSFCTPLLNSIKSDTYKIPFM